jgi:UrcA family protein
MSNRALTVGLFLATAGLAAATTAATPSYSAAEESGVTVRYHEDELATSDGTDRVYWDLDRAAHRVCDDTGEYVLRRSFAPCERAALASAVSEISSANLTTEFNLHFPGEPLRPDEQFSQRLRAFIVVVVG